MKFQTNILSFLLAVTSSISLIGCGDSVNTNEKNATSNFSLGISDAPVDGAEVVSIQIDTIKLTNQDESGGKQEFLIEEFINEAGETLSSIQINLLDYQGTDQIKIVDEAQGIVLETGVYSMELVIIDAGSYVMLKDDDNQYDIKVPSSRLRLGNFTVSENAVQIADTPAYTIEFDLRQSLVLRGNNPSVNGYILKPHGVRIVSLAGSISGTISADNTDLGPCTVYLYDGSPTELGDIFDTTDELFEGETPSATAPVATTLVADDATYAIGFVAEGSYTVALTCGDDIDDSIQFDGIAIPSIEGNFQTVEVISDTTVDASF